MKEITQDDLLNPRKLVICEDAIFPGGVFLLKTRKSTPWVILQGRNFTIDLNYTVLDGGDYKGIGIYLNSCQNITVKNGNIKRFFYGVVARRCEDIRFVGNNISNNFDNPDAGWLDDDYKGNVRGFGGGVLFKHTKNSLIQNNSICHQFNGIDLIYCDNIDVVSNNCSLNSNWGLHLLKSYNCNVSNNRMDHCIRYLDNRHDLAGGCDSAGILLEEGSSYNRFIDNSCIHSGDGVFLRANNLRRNSHNYFLRNNGSYSPHNAFEDGFGVGNIFDGNIASESDYGFWLPEACNAILRGNKIEKNKKNGIVIGLDRNIALVENSISGNGGEGI